MWHYKKLPAVPHVQDLTLMVDMYESEEGLVFPGNSQDRCYRLMQKQIARGEAVILEDGEDFPERKSTVASFVVTKAASEAMHRELGREPPALRFNPHRDFLQKNPKPVPNGGGS